MSTTSAPLGGEGAPDEPEAETDAPRGDVDVIDERDLGFAFPVPGMMMKHASAEPVPEWWEEAACPNGR